MNEILHNYELGQRNEKNVFNRIKWMESILHVSEKENK